ncbi:MAG TPA: GNAT family protein [Gaiellaceae bacterium]|nr:GNAT family protein [Gaiellaceae bacterium]
MSEQPRSDGVVALRPWTAADAPALVDCVDGDEAITEWLDRIPQPYTLADAFAYIGGVGEQAFAVTDAGDGTVLGSIALRWNDDHDVAEVGYWLRSAARGRGITTRALRLVTKIAFGEGAARVQLRAAVGNDASRRVAEKGGFRLEGVLRSAHWSPRLQRRLDWAMYSLLRDDA